MKKPILVVLGGFAIILVMVVAYFVYSLYFAERVSPPDRTEYSSEGVDLSIVYSRPFKKDRLIFGTESEGALQPYGEYWRLGANEATKFTTSKPVNIMDNKLDAGSYSIYAIPGKDKWIVAFNTSFDHWGAFRPDEDDDVFRVEIVPNKISPFVEQMEIKLEASDSHLAVIVVRWDEVELRIPVDVE